ncbi:MAG: ornithine cyclodeaminase family protein [Gaiellaceae bacterium MAG52_C11]|nr:ornithine cyclodeaminase family protein [Candidatus Gaiellasilicea maunaloa]
MLIVSGEELRELLTMEDCVDALALALVEFSQGRAVVPGRSYLTVSEGNGRVAIMPGALPRSEALGVKLMSRFADNAARGLPDVSGLVVLHDYATGMPLAAMDAAYITAVRTAAASALATKHLARPDSKTLAILGAGSLGRAHVWAMLAVCPVRTVRVWSRTAESAERFRRDVETEHSVLIEVCATARDAADGADIVCTTSSATSPILKGSWLAPGVHVNAVGAHGADARELDGEAIGKARVVVDSMEVATRECGEIVLAVAEGRLSVDDLVGELGEVIDGRKQGRLAPSDITIYKSLGIAVQDVATASLVYRKALARGVGTEVEIAVPGTVAGGRDVDRRPFMSPAQRAARHTTHGGGGCR